MYIKGSYYNDIENIEFLQFCNLSQNFIMALYIAQKALNGMFIYNFHSGLYRARFILTGVGVVM